MFLNPESIDALQSGIVRDCLAMLPELIVCGTILFMLIVRLFPAFDQWHLGLEALTLTVLALAISFTQWLQQPPLLGGYDLFGHMIRYDYFTIFMRMVLLGFTALTIWLSLLTGIPDREDSADFYSLLLGATLGMMLMASANHLLMVFIAVEMASIPSFALAGFLKGKRQSSEAALKYVVYGGGASGIMLYGISLIAGKFGTGYLPDLARAMPLAMESRLDLVLVLGILLILVGLGFKLSLVPFHFWCPDVFEGAAAEVAGFLSVASKGAALALLGRFVLVLMSSVRSEALVYFLVPTLAFFAAITATFGNLAAYPQTNLKRLLAYSTIAQAGYMVMALATLTPEGASAVLFYLVTYVFMNLGAFAIIAFLRNLTGSEELSSFRGLVYRSPVLVVTLAIFLLSLLGVPPLAGFAAKFQVFQALYRAGDAYLAQGEPGLGYILIGLLVIGGINSVFSVVYYIRVLKVMIIERPIEEVEGRPAEELPVPPAQAFYASLLAAMLFLIGILWDPLARASDKGTTGFSRPRPAPAAVARSEREAQP